MSAESLFAQYGENVDTWRLGDADQREEVLDRLDELVLKPVDGSGGKGIVIGPSATRAELDELRGKILASPRDWIAQPVISLSTVPTLVEEASIDERTTCEHLLSVMGIEDYDGEPNLNTILELLAHSPDSSASIVSAVDGARESARAICDFLHQRLAYLPGSTTVNHTAADSWAAGSGVCQDFAHVSIGLLREAGIPAHRHVVVARGRSYPDCPPLRGIYSSGGQSELFVSVEITRVH